MKKVFFSKAAQNIIPVDEVSRYAIIGYAGKNSPIKGMLALAHSQTIGITLVNGPADADMDMPAVHPHLECATREVNKMMKERQNEFDFFVFANIEDLLMWLLPE